MRSSSPLPCPAPAAAPAYAALLALLALSLSSTASVEAAPVLGERLGAVDQILGRRDFYENTAAQHKLGALLDRVLVEAAELEGFLAALEEDGARAKRRGEQDDLEDAEDFSLDSLDWLPPAAVSFSSRPLKMAKKTPQMPKRKISGLYAGRRMQFGGQ